VAVGQGWVGKPLSLSNPTQVAKRLPASVKKKPIQDLGGSGLLWKSIMPAADFRVAFRTEQCDALFFSGVKATKASILDSMALVTNKHGHGQHSSSVPSLPGKIVFHRPQLIEDGRLTNLDEDGAKD
jgi:hypothetical protein